jgi:zinc/manganese transport system substrate-binding protein
VPAVTTRLLLHRLRSWQVATVLLAAAEGVFGLWLSVQTDAPPGATIAVVAGGAFAVAALARVLRTRRAVALAAVAAAGLVAGGCGASSSGDRLPVVATTPVVADLARQVGGDAVEVTQLLHPNSDPHEYEPRPSDVVRTAEARVVLESGFGLDHWIGDVVEEGGADADVVDLSAHLPVALAADGEHAHDADEHAHGGDHDPHWWHDPRNAIAAVREIEQALAQADPAGRAAFARRADAAVARLRALDAETRRCLDRVPSDERKLVTDHDALGYFAHRYGLDVVGAVIPSQTTRAQASAGEVAGLVRTIRAEGVRAIFPESSVNRKLASAIAEQTGARIGEPLYGDTLGPEGSTGATYLAAERHNADAIARGISGGAVRCGEARS